ncbi:hypothetical protein [Xylanimonas sp. McL0601]|uniref:hypothetical protein n=1 Tax=Xylanimonas sp. McL0601 TaxID=3414739 RepID=UPI003CEABF17
MDTYAATHDYAVLAAAAGAVVDQAQLVGRNPEAEDWVYNERMLQRHSALVARLTGQVAADGPAGEEAEPTRPGPLPDATAPEN